MAGCRHIPSSRIHGPTASSRVSRDRVHRSRADRRTRAGRSAGTIARGLQDEDARALLAAVIPGRLDDQVRDRLVAETRGNPLALVELPRGRSTGELAGGFVLPGAGTLPSQIEDRFRQRIATLPEATQRLMLLAAADPVGDATLLWRAAATLGIEIQAAECAAGVQLLEVGAQVRFRHPLVRSAVYRAANLSDRRAVHG